MQDLHKDLMTNTSESLSLLRNCRIDTIHLHPDPLGLLQEIATELNFDILFDDLFNLSHKPKGELFIFVETDLNSVCMVLLILFAFLLF